MILAKLTTAMKAFNEPQFKRLNEYIHSSYFQVPCASVALFDYLQPLYPEFSEKKIQSVIIARKVKNLPNDAAQRSVGSICYWETLCFSHSSSPTPPSPIALFYTPQTCESLILWAHRRFLRGNRDHKHLVGSWCKFWFCFLKTTLSISIWCFSLCPAIPLFVLSAYQTFLLQHKSCFLSLPDNLFLMQQLFQEEEWC